MKGVLKLFILTFSVCIQLSAQYTTIIDCANSSNGRNPSGALIADSNYLYGTTLAGGTNDDGTIFKIKPDGSGYVKLFDLWSSCKSPFGSLIMDSTYLYGMTRGGGFSSNGTVFKLKKDGTGFVVLHSLDGINTGGRPYGSLAFDGTFMYGLTSEGGIYNKGAMFKIKKDGSGFAKIFDFDSTYTGRGPRGTLILIDTCLYGYTDAGGINDCGVIFRIRPDGSHFTKLMDFDGSINGMYPKEQLFFDGTYLYGMTAAGGTYNEGTIFRISIDGSNYSTLFNFDDLTSGSSPSGSLIFDGTYFYGLTSYGGAYNVGTIFRIQPDGSAYTTFHDFAGVPNGNLPNSSLYSDGVSLYGTTYVGGSNSIGTVFKFQYNTFGIPNTDLELSFNIFPNPSFGNINIVASNDINNATIEIIDNLGQTLRQYKSDLLSGSIHTIDLSQFANGSYILRINDFKTVIVKK